MKKLIILWFIGSNIFANTITSSIETTTTTLVVTTTEKGVIIFEEEIYLFSLDKSRAARLKNIIEGYKELNSLADKANYISYMPKGMRSYDNKYLQFSYRHSAKDDASFLILTVDLGSYKAYKAPFTIVATLEQWEAIMLTLDQGFSYMDEISSEVLKLRAIENEI